MARLRIVVGEDDIFVARAMRRALSFDFDIVAIVNNSVELVTVSRELRPDVVVTDFSMPGGDGLTAARQLLEADPRVRIVLTTGNPSSEMLMDALKVGVLGYIPKGHSLDHLKRAIEAAARGECYISWTGI